MKRNHSYVEGSLAVRLASAAGAAALSFAILGALVGTMAPSGHDVGYALATEVTVVPARIEVVGTRAPTIVRSVAAPHAG